MKATSRDCCRILPSRRLILHLVSIFIPLAFAFLPFDRRREREQKKLARAAKSKGKKPSKKKKAKTSGDAAMAASLLERRGSARNKDASGAKGKKLSALKKIREERMAKKDDESESDLDYGDEGEEDSDEDYMEGGAVSKPWLQKGRKTRLQRDDSSDSESEEEGAVQKTGRPTQEEKGFVAADIEDYTRVSIPRRRLARWCNEPFFEDAVKGFYVRLSIGADKAKMKTCYRLCEIVGVETRPSAYRFPQVKKQKPISTNKVLNLKFGSQVKAFKMFLISDSRPTDDDISMLVNQLKNSRLNHEILSKKRARKLRKDQDRLVTNYTYTKADIEKSIAAKKKRKVGNIGMEKTRVAIQVQGAQEAVAERIAKLDDAKRALLEAGEDSADVEQLESMVTLAAEATEDAKGLLEARLKEQRKVLGAEEGRKKKFKQSEKIQKWNRVNEDRKALNKQADYNAYKEHIEQEKREAGSQGAPKFNPYARRKAKPTMLWEVGQTTEEGGDKAKKDPPTLADEKEGGGGGDRAPSAGGSSSSSSKENVKGKDNAATSVLTEAAVEDFAIDDDEDLARGSSAAMLLNDEGVDVGRHRVRKGLSLAQYQAKKEAGEIF